MNPMTTYVPYTEREPRLPPGFVSRMAIPGHYRIAFTCQGRETGRTDQEESGQTRFGSQAARRHTIGSREKIS